MNQVDDGEEHQIDKRDRLAKTILPPDFVEQVEKNAQAQLAPLVKKLTDMVMQTDSRDKGKAAVVKLQHELLTDQYLDLFIVWLVRQAIARWLRENRHTKPANYDGAFGELTKMMFDMDFEAYLDAEVLPMGKEAETLVQIAAAYLFQVFSFCIYLE